MTDAPVRLLYIDDDPALCRLVQKDLSRHGYEVTCVNSGDEGLAALTEAAYEIVVLTTTDDAVEIQRCYDLGCNVYITKPVNYENFAHAILQLGLFFSVMQVPAAD